MSEADELLAAIEAVGLTVPLERQLEIARGRLEELDLALVDARGVLVATRDPGFLPNGWTLPVGEAIRDIIAQRERAAAFADELERRVQGDRPT